MTITEPRIHPGAGLETLTFPRRFCGPPGMGNGGWVAGSMADLLGSDAAQVTLHAPAPLDHPLDVERCDTLAVLLDGDRVIAEAVPASPLATPPPFVDLAEAAATASRFPRPPQHPFPSCFVCGPDRAAGDGLRIFPGPLGGAPGRVAAVWYAPVDADLLAPDGTVSRPAIWAALDCPSAFAHLEPGGVALLARLTARVVGPIEPGEGYVVVGRADGIDGRKRYGTSAIYDRTGRLLAVAGALWTSIHHDHQHHNRPQEGHR